MGRDHFLRRFWATVAEFARRPATVGAVCRTNACRLLASLAFEPVDSGVVVDLGPGSTACGVAM